MSRWDEALVDSLPVDHCTDEDVIKIVRKAKAEGVREVGRQLTRIKAIGFGDQAMIVRMAEQIERGEL